MPLTEADLEALFKDRCIARGNERYFAPEVAREFIEACAMNGLAIVGVEAFEQREQDLVPRLDLIADFSTDPDQAWEELHEEANRAATRFVEALKGPRLLVNLTVLSRSEWESSP